MKRFEKIFFTLAVIVALSTTSFAYIDPSVMTYIIQAVAGVVIAVGATVGILWRRAKKKVSKALKIDENSNKEVEDDVRILDEDGSEAEKKASEEAPEESSEEQPEKKSGKKKDTGKHVEGKK